MNEKRALFCAALTLIVALAGLTVYRAADREAPPPVPAQPSPETEAPEPPPEAPPATSVGGCDTPCNTSTCPSGTCYAEVCGDHVDLGVRCCTDGGQEFQCSGNQTVHVYTCDCGCTEPGPCISCPSQYSFKLCGT